MESSKRDPYLVVGGARIGEHSWYALNASWPLAELRIGNSALELSCLRKRWVFPKESIVRLSRHRGLFSVGLRVEHGVKDYEPFVVFWTFRFGRLRQELESRGYLVHAVIL